MRNILITNSIESTTYYYEDPSQYYETDFEAEIVSSLPHLLPNYLIGVFSGSFH